MLTQTFSCGNIIEYDLKDQGKSFRCKHCRQYHSFPKPPKRIEEKVLDGLVGFMKKFNIFQELKLQDNNGFSMEGLVKSFFYHLGLLVYTPVNKLLNFINRKPQETKKENPVTPPKTAEQRFKDTTLFHYSMLPSKLVDLKWELTEQLWRKDNPKFNLTIPVNKLNPPNWNECIRVMLDHARKVAPQLYIPTHIPRLVFAGTQKDTGGSFSVDGGLVTITIRISLIENYPIALAVLAHELCHYILINCNGIRKEDTLTNEQMTDICMFALGFGEIFMNGHRDFSSGHTYGYLNRSDYFHLHKVTIAEWKNKNFIKFLKTELEDLEIEVVKRVCKGHRVQFKKIYNNIKKKHPNLSKKDILEKMLYEQSR